MKIQLETDRLKIISCEKELLEHILQGEKAIAEFLQINVAKNWSHFGKSAFQYSYNQISKNATGQGWWTFLPILKKENTLIGSCGFKGQPDENGMVEIGYEIADDFQNQGFATEIANALVQHAFQFENVKTVWGHTLSEKNASTKVLMKCGFQKTKEIQDEEEGWIWRWEIKSDR